MTPLEKLARSYGLALRDPKCPEQGWRIIAILPKIKAPRDGARRSH